MDDGAECLKMERVVCCDVDCSGEDRKPPPKHQVFYLDFQDVIGDARKPLVTKLKAFHFAEARC